MGVAKFKFLFHILLLFFILNNAAGITLLPAVPGYQRTLFVALTIWRFPNAPGSRLTMKPASRSACFTVPFDGYVTCVPPGSIWLCICENIPAVHNSGWRSGAKASKYTRSKIANNSASHKSASNFDKTNPGNISVEASHGASCRAMSDRSSE